jgi:hypothetical protein
MRVDDAGIAAGGCEMQVELALAMAQQDHLPGLKRLRTGGKGGDACDSFVMCGPRAYLW